MHKLTITTRAWENLKKRLDIDDAKFTKNIKNGETEIIFNSILDCADVFKKIAEFNEQLGNDKIKEAYINMIKNK